jgi:hypothetical protein
MLVDKFLEFCDATDVSAAAGTALVGDVIDLTTIGLDLNAPNQGLFLVVQVTTAFTSGGSSTNQFKIVTDAAAAIATDGTATEHALSSVLGKTTLAADYQLVLPLARGAGGSYERYMGVLNVTAAATTTAGSINAFLSLSPPAATLFAEAAN